MPLLIVLAATSAAVAMLGVILRDVRKAAIITSAVVLPVMLFGLALEQLPASFENGRELLLGLSVLFVAVAAVVALKPGRQLGGITSGLNIISLVLLLFVAIPAVRGVADVLGSADDPAAGPTAAGSDLGDSQARHLPPHLRPLWLGDAARDRRPRQQRVRRLAARPRLRGQRRRSGQLRAHDAVGRGDARDDPSRRDRHSVSDAKATRWAGRPADREQPRRRVPPGPSATSTSTSVRGSTARGTPRSPTGRTVPRPRCRSRARSST